MLKSYLRHFWDNSYIHLLNCVTNRINRIQITESTKLKLLHKMKTLYVRILMLIAIYLICYFDKSLLIESLNNNQTQVAPRLDFEKAVERVNVKTYLNHSLAKRSVYRKRLHHKSKGPRNLNCKKLDYNVNFGELGWEKWIIYPKVFNAFFCSGSCVLPFQQFSKAMTNNVPSTNHAQIMSILEFKNPNLNRQMAKCVSTKLKPLTVVFLDESGIIKTKVYQDMVVDECGCR